MINGISPILEAQNLQKKYKDTLAVNDVSFSVSQGTCFGLLGPNGAGKTTTIEILEDIIDATSGKVLFKNELRTNAYREEIGIQFQHTSLLYFLSVKETLQTFAKLFSNPEKLDTLIEQCELSSILEKKNDKLSGGQLQRLMLALALINKPRLIFLDEPSTGLDPQSRRNLWKIVEQIKNDGKTILLTTHSMEEAEYLCDEIAIMDQGVIISQGSPQELITTHCGGSSIFLSHTLNSAALSSLPYDFKIEGDIIRIDCDNVPQVLRNLVDLDINLMDMSVSSSNLEDVFIRLTGRKLRD